MEQPLKEQTDELITQNIGVSRIPIGVLKRFQEFAIRETNNNYAQAIEVLLNFFEQGVVRMVLDHEERISKLEKQETKEETRRVPTFGGIKDGKDR